MDNALHFSDDDGFGHRKRWLSKDLRDALEIRLIISISSHITAAVTSGLSNVHDIRAAYLGMTQKLLWIPCSFSVFCVRLPRNPCSHTTFQNATFIFESRAIYQNLEARARNPRALPESTAYCIDRPPETH